MITLFRIVGLPVQDFAPLFAMTDSELSQRSARRLIVDAKPGFPCRVTLEDAEIGEKVILLPFTHHDVESPYRSSGPIFVRETAQQKELEPGEIPPVVANRLLSLRAYDKDGMMIDAAVTPGTELKQRIETVFANAKARYLHIHNAGAGCYSCRVERAEVVGS